MIRSVSSGQLDASPPWSGGIHPTAPSWPVAASQRSVLTVLHRDGNVANLFLQCKENPRPYGRRAPINPLLAPVLRIHIGFNADPDPAFFVNADPDTDPDPELWWPKMGKKLQLKKIIFFWSIRNSLIRGLHKRLTSRSLQPSKHLVLQNFSSLLWVILALLDPDRDPYSHYGSWSGSSRSKWMRIRIHITDWLCGCTSCRGMGFRGLSWSGINWSPGSMCIGYTYSIVLFSVSARQILKKFLFIHVRRTNQFFTWRLGVSFVS